MTSLWILLESFLINTSSETIDIAPVQISLLLPTSILELVLQRRFYVSQQHLAAGCKIVRQATMKVVCWSELKLMRIVNPTKMMSEYFAQVMSVTAVKQIHATTTCTFLMKTTMIWMR